MRPIWVLPFRQALHLILAGHNPFALSYWENNTLQSVCTASVSELGGDSDKTYCWVVDSVVVWVR